MFGFMTDLCLETIPAAVLRADSQLYAESSLLAVPVEPYMVPGIEPESTALNQARALPAIQSTFESQFPSSPASTAEPVSMVSVQETPSRPVKIPLSSVLCFTEFKSCP